MGRQTNTQRRRAQGSAREKAAAARQAAARQQRRRRVIVLAGVTIGVLAVIGAIVAVGVTSSSGKKSAGDLSRPAADPTVVSQVTGVSAATLDAVGKGKLISTPKPANDPPLTANGHPEVLYIGAEYCPYCAAERWALVQALSRFGTFTGLKAMHSAANDVFPNTPTFSFYGATYTSDVVTFTPRELETVTHAPLEKNTAAEDAIWHKYTGQGSFPFIDIGGRWVATSPSYDQTVLKGLTAIDIAGQLNDPNSPVAKGIDGAANVLTAAICKVTNNAPANVCTASGVTAAAAALAG